MRLRLESYMTCFCRIGRGDATRCLQQRRIDCKGKQRAADIAAEMPTFGHASFAEEVETELSAGFETDSKHFVILLKPAVHTLKCARDNSMQRSRST